MKKGRIKFNVFLILGFILALAPFVLADTQTELNVPNSPPEFSGLIPNFSWTNGPLLDAFNMNDYFEDLQGDFMNFYSTGNSSIGVNISENGFVSFYPPVDYFGVEVLTFYAEDAIGATPSNFVYLGVGVDLEPPKWFYPKKSKSKVYQNDFIEFSANWTDNFELESYYLAIDQGNGWEFDNGVFSGKANQSYNKVQISAPIGKVVKWKVCAKDSSQNLGCTDEYEFTVLKMPLPPETDGDYDGEGGSGGDGTSVGGRITGENIKDLYKDAEDLIGSQDKEDYSMDVDSFLVDLKQGDSLTRVFEIINTGTNDLYFELSITGIEEYSTISAKNFTLGPGEKKTVTVEFSVDLTFKPGQYFGTLIVKSSQDVVIPIVLNVNSVNLDFFVVVEVLPEYMNVKPGKEVVASLNITNNGDLVSSNVVLTYAIKDFYGNIYNSQEEEFTLESIVSMEKSLVVPEEILLGKYIFYARVLNEKEIAIGADDFEVGLSFKFEAFIKSSSIFLIILVLCVVSIIMALRYKRQKEKERALNLYVKLNELKEMVKEGKFEKAANLYIAIKRIYGEPVSKAILDDKQKLIDEIKKLSGRINFDEAPVQSENSEGTEEKTEGEEKTDNKKVEEKEVESKEESKEDEVDKKEKVEEKEVEEKKEVEEVSEEKVESKDLISEKDKEENIEKNKDSDESEKMNEKEGEKDEKKD